MSVYPDQTLPHELRDLAKDVKDGLAIAWAVNPPGTDPHVGVEVTLHVDDDWRPDDTHVAALLVANDGGPRWFGGPWTGVGRRAHRKPLLRLTAFAKGRYDARNTVMDAADWVCDHKKSCGIARIEDVSDALVTRDRATGAYLASVTMPAIVRP